jgi:hypothetical protein
MPGHSARQAQQHPCPVRGRLHDGDKPQFHSEDQAVTALETRIEELARLAVSAHAQEDISAEDWIKISDLVKDAARRIARVLYVEIMSKDAAGVARQQQEFFLRRSNEREGPAEVFELARGNAAQTISSALEARAQEAQKP